MQCHTSPHLTSPHLASPRLASPRLLKACNALSCVALFCHHMCTVLAAKVLVYTRAFVKTAHLGSIDQVLLKVLDQDPDPAISFRVTVMLTCGQAHHNCHHDSATSQLVKTFVNSFVAISCMQM